MGETGYSHALLPFLRLRQCCQRRTSPSPFQDRGYPKGVRGDHGGGVELHCPYVRGSVRGVAPVYHPDHDREPGPVLPGGRGRRHVEGDVEGRDTQVPRVAREDIGEKVAQRLPEVWAEKHDLFLLYGRKADEAAGLRRTGEREPQRLVYPVEVGEV